MRTTSTKHVNRPRRSWPRCGWVKIQLATKGNRFDGLYIGRQEGDELIYAGKVDHGFDNASAKDFAGPAQAADWENAILCQEIAHRGVWVEPWLLAEIEYRAKSAAGKVRHPFFKGIREDL
jgi:bifunctional non-homologous end joining protein LigD